MVWTSTSSARIHLALAPSLPTPSAAPWDLRTPPARSKRSIRTSHSAAQPSSVQQLRTVLLTLVGKSTPHGCISTAPDITIPSFKGSLVKTQSGLWVETLICPHMSETPHLVRPTQEALRFILFTVEKRTTPRLPLGTTRRWPTS